MKEELQMKFFRKKKTTTLKAFASGSIVPLNEVNDEMFSQGLMGPGIAIKSNDGKFYSPVAGAITMVFPTLHAIGIKTNEGIEILLHIGIDTVNLKGEGFISHVKINQEVQPGDLLLEADLKLLEAKGYATEAILCISEPKELDLTWTSSKNVISSKDDLAIIRK